MGGEGGEWNEELVWVSYLWAKFSRRFRGHSKVFEDSWI